MDTIPCPGCRTDLEPSATNCPICLRPRGKLEITRAYATLREMEKQRRRRPFVVAGYLLAAGAVGGLLYRFHGPIAAAAVSARAGAGRLVDAMQASADASVHASRPRLTAAPPAETPPPTAASASPFASASPAPAPAQPAPASPVKAADRPAAAEELPLPPAFDPSTQWVVNGRVYDLITLLPIADVQLSFAVAGAGMAAAARSDARGRFAVVLPRLAQGSYELRASRSGYASSALYESDIPYATLPLSERNNIARSAQDGDMSLPPLTDVAGEGSMRRDVFLAPSR